MDSKTIQILLVTANVGSIFEDPSPMLKVWTEEFLATVTKLDPKFIALHCQEVGGKKYENSMKHVEDFVSLLMSSNELRLFDKVRVFLDEDYSSAENFTALGNFYFVHESVEDVLIWNFKELQFVSCNGKEIHSGNIEAVVTKEKSKFPQDFFPECKWSRKGFLRTRWSIDGTVIDMINIHLFHDASNFVAMETSPSVYSTNRRRALEHTLQRFHNDKYGIAPYFLFGDFNFRTDTDGVIKKLTEGLTKVRIQNNRNNEFSKLQYTNENSDLVLTVGKKEFNHSDHNEIFLQPSETWLKSYDKELEAFKDNLTEFPISFPPSYPFEESISKAKSYMQTRCPAWCDRVLLSHTAKKLIQETDKIQYDLMGRDTCMGDHKPVYLRADILSNSGTIKCCNHALYDCLPLTCKCCRSFSSVAIFVEDMSADELDYLSNSYTDVTINSYLLHEPITRDMLSHEPYTPESADSHSPNPEKIEIDLSILRRRSVSPLQLKHRLESFLLETSRTSMKRSVSQDVNDGCPKQRHLFRTRAMSEIPQKQCPATLNSLGSKPSISRLESHHSSSDEDWYQFDEIQIKDKPISIEINDNGVDCHKKVLKSVNKNDRKKRNCCSIL